MPELQILQISQWVWKPLGVVVLVVLVAFLVVRYALKSDKARNLAQTMQRFWLLLIIVAVLALAAFALPFFIDDTKLSGVVVHLTTGALVQDARVTVDGIPQLGFTTGSDGNFSIPIPSRDRKEDYSLRAQKTVDGTVYTGQGTIRDDDARTKLVPIAIPLPNPVARTPASTEPSSASPRLAPHLRVAAQTSAALLSQISATDCVNYGQQLPPYGIVGQDVLCRGSNNEIARNVAADACITVDFHSADDPHIRRALLTQTEISGRQYTLFDGAPINGLVKAHARIKGDIHIQFFWDAGTCLPQGKGTISW